MQSTGSGCQAVLTCQRQYAATDFALQYGCCQWQRTCCQQQWSMVAESACWLTKKLSQNTFQLQLMVYSRRVRWTSCLSHMPSSSSLSLPAPVGNICEFAGGGAESLSSVNARCVLLSAGGAKPLNQVTSRRWFIIGGA
eukprot:GHRR01037567.1.p1 GENE.GHRR01037567.1~~GHRR01037567.1.p1  ORF type:complete len:139 (+),score=17.75 GHRR01037567.1:138-554(+)